MARSDVVERHPQPAQRLWHVLLHHPADGSPPRSGEDRSCKPGSSPPYARPGVGWTFASANLVRSGRKQPQRMAAGRPAPLIPTIVAMTFAGRAPTFARMGDSGDIFGSEPPWTEDGEEA